MDGGNSEEFSAAYNGHDPVVLRLTGELDIATGPSLSGLIELMWPIRSVEVDMTRLRFMDCAGMRPLIRLRNDLSAAGGQMRVVGATGIVAQLLDLTGVFAGCTDPTSTAGRDETRPQERAIETWVEVPARRRRIDPPDSRRREHVGDGSGMSHRLAAHRPERIDR